MAESSLTTAFDDRKRLRLESGEADTLSPRTYNLAITGVLCYGLLANAAMVHLLGPTLAATVAGISPWLLLLAYLVPTFAGTFIAIKSHNPMVSFLGYNLVVLPVGLLLALIIPGMPTGIVTRAMGLTAAVTAAMMILSAAYPRFFLGLGRTLLVVLAVGIVAEIVATWLLGYRGTAFDWLFVLLFSGYIGYDISKSQAYPKTLDNAVDSALDIYLDVINLFIRLLSLLSKKN